ncbi:hypothetical protein BMF77_01202 [Dolichospermum sp. UHCC 0315A]|jgi:hypothetical protein|uniref:hypothetical protein n=1 Tax=Dolichospermum sp. UHCC 0315A TaxID=1914871 RepID=UPI0011E69E4F|nr:hypothetical protein [Dolichospermum sp. UHCC 0315A]QEI40632.1 hypothetical protein BMF77_01202 [Dolichospermum sp. UHCC 0315A]
MGEAKRRKQLDQNYGKTKEETQAQIIDIALLDCCDDILSLLNSAEGREKEIALAIVDRYGINSVKGQPMTHYHYVDTAIQLKREGDFNESIDYYNQFFRESGIGKGWFMTYYGVAKTLALAGKYSDALIAINIAIALASITQCADSDYVYERHYKSILALKQGKVVPGYLVEIQG